jgi:hypothetical protein
VNKIKELQTAIDAEIKNLSHYLNKQFISKILEVAQTIINIHEEINYINGLVGITNDQTPPKYYFLPKEWDGATTKENEENLQRAIDEIKKVKEKVKSFLENNRRVDDVIDFHGEIIRTNLRMQQNATKCNKMQQNATKCNKLW